MRTTSNNMESTAANTMATKHNAAFKEKQIYAHYSLKKDVIYLKYNDDQKILVLEYYTKQPENLEEPENLEKLEEVRFKCNPNQFNALKKLQLSESGDVTYVTIMPHIFDANNIYAQLEFAVYYIYNDHSAVILNVKHLANGAPQTDVREVDHIEIWKGASFASDSQKQKAKDINVELTGPSISGNAYIIDLIDSFGETKTCTCPIDDNKGDIACPLRSVTYDPDRIPPSEQINSFDEDSFKHIIDARNEFYQCNGHIDKPVLDM